MQMIEINGVALHYRDEGPRDGAPVVFSNSLGTDLRLWDQIIPLLPEGLRLIRYDKRGHGLSDGPDAPYFMGDLVQDLATLLDRLEVKNAFVVGLSIGGLIVQGLAAERPDLVRALVLSNTGAKIGTEDIWQGRIDTARAEGVGGLADGTMERWFSQEFHKNRNTEMQAWRNMFSRTPVEGFTGCGAAIAGTDLYKSTAQLTVPTLGIAGSEDGGTPPDLVRETTALVQGSEFELIRGAGHLPCVEAPERYAEILTRFMKRTGTI